MRYCQSRQDAQDAFQDGFIKVFRHIQTYSGEQSFEGWVRRIIVNTCIDKQRKKNWMITNFSEHPYIGELTIEDTEEPPPIECSKERLLELMQELPSQYRAVFNLYVFEEYSHQQIAETLQISVGTSKSNLSRAKNWLRKAITNENILEKNER